MQYICSKLLNEIGASPITATPDGSIEPDAPVESISKLFIFE